MHRPRKLLAGGLVVALLGTGCQPGAHGPGAGDASLVVDPTPAALLAPNQVDWATQRVSSRHIQLSRQAHRRKLMAFPTATGAWAGGKALTDYGCAASDFVPNGPAASYFLQAMIILTKEGKLIKADTADPSVFELLDLGKTFTRTAVTLSFNSSRCYVVADDGTLFVVNLDGDMSVMTSQALGGAYGCAPFIDPYTSSPTHDDVYVPANDGKVHKYRFTSLGTAPYYTMSGPTTYDVATMATPIAGTRKVAAPAVVLGGKIFLGDQGGSLRLYDTWDTANNVTFGIGAPINTAPALEIQDGSYTGLTNPDGTPKSVAGGQPVYAFVSAGGTCAYINLHDYSTYFSLGLRIDDNNTAKKFGYLLDYNYSTSGTTEYMAALDGGNINTEAPDQTLPGTSPATIWSNNYLVPAETNTRLAANGSDPAGGPIVSYLRWAPTSPPGEGAVLISAELGIKCAFDEISKVPEVRTTSHLYADGTGPWASNALTNANRPAIGSSSVGIFTSGGVNGSGNVDYRDNRCYFWDVTNAFSGPQSAYALALKHNAGGASVLWPEGPFGQANSPPGQQRRASQVMAVKFLNNPLNANPAAPTGAACAGTEVRPILKTVIASAQLPTASIETPPVIDAITKKAYVFYTNALYEVDWSSPARWTDTVSGSKFTLFNMAFYGDSTNGGATFWTKKRYVGNFSAPAMNYDGTAMYVLNRYPNPNNVELPTTWNYAPSKITLPLSSAANQLVAGSPTFTGLAGAARYDGSAKEASTYLVVDPFSNATTTGGNVWFGLNNGKIYQYDK